MNSTNFDSVLKTKVPLGINLVFYGLELFAASILSSMLLPFFIGGNLKLLLSFLSVMGILLVGASILSLVGKVFCLTAPNDLPSKKPIYLSITFDLLAIGLGITSNFVELPALVETISSILGILALIFFLVFLRALSQYLQDEKLAKMSSGLLRLGVAYIIFWVLAQVSAIYFPPATILFLLLVFVLGIVGLIRYSRLLLGLKKATVTPASVT